MLSRLFRRSIEIAEAAAGSGVLDPPRPETLTVTETTGARLLERSVRSDGTIPIRIISPGHGSSGYYSPEVLERAAADGVFPAGLHMFMDHPGRADEANRPERSLRDLVGTLATPGVWQPNHPDGPGIYAEATVYGPWRDVIAEMASDIGVSIRASAQVTHGNVDGHPARIVERIDQARSVDYVTAAGRGGRILEILEAARSDVDEARNVADWIEVEIPRAVIGLANGMWGEGGTLSRTEWEAVNDATADAMDAFRARLSADAPQLLTRDPAADPAAATSSIDESQEDTDMDTKQLEEAVAKAVDAKVADLTEANTKLQTDLDEATSKATEAETRAARAEEALIARQASDHVVAKLAESNGLPGPTVKRLTESLSAQAPITDDGKLDTAKLDESITSAVNSELDYLASVTGSPVKGAGGTVTESADDVDLVGAFQRFGLSESGAKIAAEGRR